MKKIFILIFLFLANYVSAQGIVIDTTYINVSYDAKSRAANQMYEMSRSANEDISAFWASANSGSSSSSSSSSNDSAKYEKCQKIIKEMQNATETHCASAAGIGGCASGFPKYSQSDIEKRLKKEGCL